MPIVDAQLSSDFARAGCRPKCHVCGRFIGVGGYFDKPLPSLCGEPAWEGGYDTCKQHTEEPAPLMGECMFNRFTGPTCEHGVFVHNGSAK